ncbi:DUF5329 family protein [Sulfurovum sp. CS9]|uniref:DUF5329 family protein n=1 Tax=Sulfurovum sp. CS9 TaxID=3391146 RepID=UPI0039ED52D7
MNHIVKKFFLLSFLLSCNSIVAQADYKTEIAHLLEYVKTTECKYIRNGTFHSGPEAVSHIKKKYDYFKNDISSAEDFIRLSATKSTMSGSKYYIKCAGSLKVESGQWLLEELDRYRKKEIK